jgi:hypothetical protein
MKYLLPLLIALLVLAGSVDAHQFHVTPDASARGDGSRRNPWRLETALRNPKSVHPGDTVWVHGGTYYGHFTSRLTGTWEKPVLLRCYPGERAIIDGGNSGGDSILMIEGSFAWYWGLEIMSSDSGRVSRETGSFPKDIARGECVTLDQDFKVAGCKFINLVLHDGKLGFDAWVPATDLEVYGCVMFNNGWLATDRPHGHNVYSQNQTGTKRFAENIVAHAFSHNFQLYGSGSAFIDNFDLEGNIIFQGGERNILIGGGRKAMNPVVKNNFLYEPAGGNVFNLGYAPFGNGAENAVVTGNFIIGGELSFNAVRNSTIEDNTIYAVSLDGVSPERYPKNTWYTRKPRGVRAFVRANYYEAGRANIVVYNWDRQGAVALDVSTVLHKGERFEIVDAENYYGPPVLQGTFTGGEISIPMVDRTAALPIGLPAPPLHSPTEFGAFVLQRK